MGTPGVGKGNILVYESRTSPLLLLPLLLRMDDTPKSTRRWLQYRLRTLLALVLLASIGMSWFMVRRQVVEKQIEAVNAIREAGGKVFYFQGRFNADGDEFVGEALPKPAWLQALMGKARVFQVRLNDTATRITDAELQHVKELTSLNHLFLENTFVTDAGLKHIEGMTELEVLLLDNTPITDAGLKHIHDLPRLRFLSLDNTKITGVGLRHMKGLLNLQDLSLDGTKVTDAALPYLEAMPNLRDVSLEGTHVTDAGLQHLKGLSKLRIVRLNGTKVTDAGLRCFEGAVQLEELELNGTKVTDEGVQILQRILPDCNIEYQMNYPY